MQRRLVVRESLLSLGKALKLAFKRNQRSQSRGLVDGDVHVIFLANSGSVSFETVALKDVFSGGFAFLSRSLFCIGLQVCISDGIEVVEVSIEHRREDGDEFVYVVSVGDLTPLPKSWQQRLEPKETRLTALLAQCRIHGHPTNSSP